VLHSPPFDAADVERLAGPWFDAVEGVVDLGSHQDRNFLLRTSRDAYVLKVANPSFGRPALELQNAAMAHLSRAGFALRTPQAVATRDGERIVVVERGGERYDVRVVTYVAGGTLRTARRLMTGQVFVPGRVWAGHPG